MGRRAKMPPGVRSLGGDLYEVRGRWTDPTRANRQEFLLQVSAPSQWDAAKWRDEEVERRKASGGIARQKPERLTFLKSTDGWLEKRSQGGLKLALRPSSLSVYRCQQRAWLAKIPGDTYVDTITSEQIAAVMNAWIAEGQTPVSVNGRLRMLRSWARETKNETVVHGVPIASTPVEVQDVEEEDDTEGRGLTPEEINLFLEQAPRDKLWPLFALDFSTGMRIGEVIALQRKHFEVSSGRIAVRRSVWEGHVSAPKTKAGIRDVYLVGTALDVMREYIEARQRTEARILGPDDILFPSERPTARNPFWTAGGIRRRIISVYEAAGIDLDGRPPLHALRHTYNNHLRQVAPELVRQAIIGHSDEKIGRRYSHMTPEEGAQYAGKVVDLMMARARRKGD